MGDKGNKAKHRICGALLVCSATLYGCGSTIPENSQTVEFDNTFEFSIPDNFKKTSAKTIDSKQIINKILKAYKIDRENGFKDNLVITQSLVGPNLDYEQFWSVNSKKLKNSLVGYTPRIQQEESFECEKETIGGIFVTFDMVDGFIDDTGVFYMSQYQFIKDGKGYIISYATADEKLRDASKDWMFSLRCLSKLL